jgi:hypothetical protein
LDRPGRRHATLRRILRTVNDEDNVRRLIRAAVKTGNSQPVLDPGLGPIGRWDSVDLAAAATT